MRCRAGGTGAGTSDHLLAPSPLGPHDGSNRVLNLSRPRCARKGGNVGQLARNLGSLPRQPTIPSGTRLPPAQRHPIAYAAAYAAARKPRNPVRGSSRCAFVASSTQQQLPARQPPSAATVVSLGGAVKAHAPLQLAERERTAAAHVGGARRRGDCSRSSAWLSRQQQRRRRRRQWQGLHVTRRALPPTLTRSSRPPCICTCC